MMDQKNYRADLRDISQALSDLMADLEDVRDDVSDRMEETPADDSLRTDRDRIDAVLEKLVQAADLLENE